MSTINRFFRFSGKITRQLFLIVLSIALLFGPGSTVLKATNWQQFGMDSLAEYVTQSASQRDLEDLARRKFNFEITENHCQGVQNYINLIRALASKIPLEYDRPVISLTIYLGQSKKINFQRSLGILGGMGPLSDASLLKLIFAEIATLKKTARDGSSVIHLLSMPPPRDTWDQITGGLAYASRLNRFARHGYGTYVLASNTAHVHYDSFQMLVRNGSVINLPEAVADLVTKQTAPEEAAFILGSKLAWENKLYSQIFTQKKKHHVRLRQGDQDLLQQWIDKIKESRLIEGERKQFYDFIVKLSEVYGTKTLVLACTEIPLGLGPHIDALRAQGFKIFDSEEIFAKTIAQHLIQKMNSRL